MNEEFEVSGTIYLVDHYGNLYDRSSKSILTSEFVFIDQRSVRTKALILNTYIENGRIDLIKHIEKPIYLITGPQGGKYYSVYLREFCDELGLNYERMKKASQRGNKTKDGWYIEIL